MSSLLKPPPGVPEEKTLLIESAAKRDKESSPPSNVYLLVSFTASLPQRIPSVFYLL